MPYNAERSSPRSTPAYLDDHQAVQLERAQADARFWESLAEMQTSDVEGHKELLATVQRAIGAREPLAADAAAKAQAAKDRLARAEKGEAVAGIPAPMTRADMLKICHAVGGAHFLTTSLGGTGNQTKRRGSPGRRRRTRLSSLHVLHPARGPHRPGLAADRHDFPENWTRRCSSLCSGPGWTGESASSRQPRPW